MAFKKTPDNVQVKQQRATNDEPLVVVIGRNNYKKQSASLDSLIHELYKLGMSVCWYESQTTKTARFLDALLQQIVPPSIVSICDRHPLVRKLIKVTILLRHPKKCSYLFKFFQERHHTSVSDLRKFIRSLNCNRITLITHSAGGIAGSLIEDEPAIEGHVCFGYPFKSPDSPEEHRRTKHLERITKPFFIMQGNQDAYGTTLDAGRYKLSPSIKLQSISTTHDYEEISQAEFDDTVLAIINFICSGKAEGMTETQNSRSIPGLGDGKALPVLAQV